jgi:hypothetical protein
LVYMTIKKRKVYATFKYLFDAGANVNACGFADGQTILIVASGAEHGPAPYSILAPKIVRLLLARGANINARSKHGQTALVAVPILKCQKGSKGNYEVAGGGRSKEVTQTRVTTAEQIIAPDPLQCARSSLPFAGG